MGGGVLLLSAFYGAVAALFLMHQTFPFWDDCCKPVRPLIFDQLDLTDSH